MAQINIKDTVWTDLRFKYLERKIGTVAAIGTLAIAWRSAQEFYKKDRSGIPMQDFLLLENSYLILESKLAETNGDFVYLKGSDACFQWLFDKQEAGRAGGRVSAARSRDKLGRLLPSRVQAESKHPSKQNPSRSNPTLTSTSSNTKNNTIDRNEIGYTEQQENQAAHDVRLDFESLYKKYPKKVGKHKGLAKCKAQIKTQIEFDALSMAIGRYRSYCISKSTEPAFIKQFDTFISCWKDWCDPDTGKVSLSAINPPQLAAPPHEVAKQEEEKQIRIKARMELINANR